jgi:hypothetical protein
MRLRIHLFYAGLFLCAAIMTGCEEDTRIRIDGENPPTFKFTGSGQVYFIRVIKEPSESKDWEKNEGGICLYAHNGREWRWDQNHDKKWQVDKIELSLQKPT